MGQKFPSWLRPQIITGISGFNLDAYLLALEGWRRGLTLTWYARPEKVTDLKIVGFEPLAKSFSLKNEETGQIHYFYRSRGDLVANEAVEIVNDKFATKQRLLQLGIPTPKGFKFSKEESIKDIIARLKHSDFSYPVVVKPVFGSLGKGVITNIGNEEELISALTKTKANPDYTEFMLEEFYQGKEYRVYVIGDRIAAATERVPANIVGDGQSNIKNLIEKKNKVRKYNPYLRTKLIEIDDTVRDYLKAQRLSLDSVPAKDEQIFLKGASNISAGGDPVDVTDSISEYMKATAIKAREAIPNLFHVGLDMIVNDNVAYIIELNGTADISMHVFPDEGVARNVPKIIIDYYFPESESPSGENMKFYFDFREIRRILRNQLTEEVTLKPISKKSYTKRFLISGKVQGVGYRKWIKRQALRRGLNGYTRNLNNGDVVVVVGGSKETVESFKKVCEQGPKKAIVNDMRELEWNGPIKLGFEIRKN